MTDKTWDHIRSVRYSTMEPPSNWPSEVRPISQDGLNLLGIVPSTNKLFWDGKEVVLRSRVRLTWWQGFLATLAGFGTFGTFLVEASQTDWWQTLWSLVFNILNSIAALSK